MSTIILAGVLFALLLLSVRLVPQGYKSNVTRLGKYKRTLEPGLNFIIPLIETTQRINLKEIVLSIAPQHVITEDNVSVHADGVLYYRIFDSFKAVYEVDNLQYALSNLVMTSLRNVIGEMHLDACLSGREQINAKILGVVEAASAVWGVKVMRVEVRDIMPPKDVVESMERQMKAERDRRAEVLKAEADRAAAIARSEGERQAAINSAEGQKQSAILEAEGRLEAAQRDAASREHLAAAEARATELVSKAISSGDVNAIAYFLGLKQVEALGKFAENQGKGTIVVPADMSALLSSFAMVKNLMNAPTNQ